MAALAAWCEEQKGGKAEEEEEEGEGREREKGALSMPRVSEIVAAKHDGAWARAKVTRQVSAR